MLENTLDFEIWTCYFKLETILGGDYGPLKRQGSAVRR